MKQYKIWINRIEKDAQSDLFAVVSSKSEALALFKDLKLDGFKISYRYLRGLSAYSLRVHSAL